MAAYTSVEVLGVRSASPKVRVLEFKFTTAVQPGQFFMIRTAGAGEIPLSAAWTDAGKAEVAVAGVGMVSNALCTLKKGDYFGVRGPHGKGFTLPKKAKRIALVAGGYGVAPLTLLARAAKKKKIKVDLFFGAQKESDLILIERAREYANVFCTTDDGSCGHPGRVTDPFKEQVEKEKYDYVYTVGPEMMMYAVYEICKKEKLPLQASIERYMKCGIGICDSCSIDGYLSCVDGPVFEMEKLKTLTEFGKTHRGPSGALEKY